MLPTNVHQLYWNADAVKSYLKKNGSMIFGKDEMISYLYRFLLLVVPLI